MSRYIDADALAYMVASNGDADFINKVTKLMIEAPSIDIVRCKECKSFGESERKSFGKWWCDFWKEAVNPDDFCSFGEV